MQEKIDKDLKEALLAGDKTKTEVLKGLKNALQYENLSGDKESKLSDEQVLKVLAREAKKRQEAADLYKQNNATDRAQTELAEKAIIDGYLPEQADEGEVTKAVEEELAKLENPTKADMGKVIGAVRGQLGPSADGALIAKLVQERLI